MGSGRYIDLDEVRGAAGAVEGLSFLRPSEREKAERAAATDVNILITGETGTGKGHLARALAAVSSRPKLIEVNCSALPDELLGSELFGHLKGAFTGAVRDRKGILSAARGKTVLLDEIGEISPRMQRMLLKTVQRSRRTIKPLGEDTERPLDDVRFFFATNRDLESDAARGNFREDLLRRIDVVKIEIPPLRERMDLFASYLGRFIIELEALHGIKVEAMTRSAFDLLRSRSWPGNARELKNVIEAIIVTGRRSDKGGVVIDLEDISPPPAAGGGTSDDLDSVIKAHIERILIEENYAISRASRRLGFKSKTSLYQKIKRYSIRLPKRNERF